MQLPPIDRVQSLRPVAVEAASQATGRVVPVAPVNPSAQTATAAEPSPSVINLISQADKANAGEGVYSSVSDPSRKSADEDSSTKDWTIQRPATEKVKDPPPEPISKVLMDHIKSLWQASASAVQVQQEVKNQLDLSQQGVKAAPGVISSEVFTYSPTKINKAEKPKS